MVIPLLSMQRHGFKFWVVHLIICGRGLNSCPVYLKRLKVYVNATGIERKTNVSMREEGMMETMIETTVSLEEGQIRQCNFILVEEVL